MITAPADPLHYLRNFRTVPEWVARRYCDLLTPDELALIERVPVLPEASRARTLDELFAVSKKSELVAGSTISSLTQSRFRCVT